MKGENQKEEETESRNQENQGQNEESQKEENQTKENQNKEHEIEENRNKDEENHERSRSVSPEHKKSKLIQTLEDEDKEFWDDVLYRKGKIEYFYEMVNEEKDPNIYQSKLYKYRQLHDSEMKEIVQITRDYAYDYRDNYIPASNERDKETVINMIIETLTKFLSIFQNELNDMYIFFDRLEIEYLVEYFKKMLE